MIDTIIINARTPMHKPDEMADLLFSRSCGHAGRDCQHLSRWKFNPPQTELAYPRLTWSMAPDGSDYLTAFLSIPKFLFGSNVKMVENQADIDRALLIVSEYVSRIAKTRFVAGAANVVRVDYCFNWKLKPSEVCEYLRVLGQTSLPRMTRYLIDTTTVQFSNESQTVVFYDKLSEVQSRLRSGRAADEEVTASVGVLRFEKRFLDSRACDRLASRLGLPNRRADSLLRVSVAEELMNDTLQQLGLDRTLESGEARLARLFEVYKPMRALTLVGFLKACDTYGVENLVRMGICSRATFHRMCREIKLAGVWLVTDQKRILPPLRLLRHTNEARVA